MPSCWEVPGAKHQRPQQRWLQPPLATVSHAPGVFQESSVDSARCSHPVTRGASLTLFSAWVSSRHLDLGPNYEREVTNASLKEQRAGVRALDWSARRKDLSWRSRAPAGTGWQLARPCFSPSRDLQVPAFSAWGRYPPYLCVQSTRRRDAIPVRLFLRLASSPPSPSLQEGAVSPAE